MNVTDIFNYFNGYAVVRITGRQPERFINLALKKKIYIWNIKKEGEETVFCVSARGFLLLRKIARKTGVRVKISGKKGFPGLIRKIKRRKAVFAAGIILFAAILAAGSLVLKIDIVGNEKLPSEKIIEKLDVLGLKKFSLRSNIDTERISRELIKEFDGISWVGVYEDGTRVTVEIKEKTPPPPMIPLDIPTDLVAAKDGIVISLNAENGEKRVKTGETVKKGQVLISGEVPLREGEESRYVHSIGNVTAETWYEKETDVKLYEYEKQYTGRTKKALVLKAFSREWGGGVVPFFNYDTEIKRYVVSFFVTDSLIYREYLLKKKTVPEKKALSRAKEDLRKEFEEIAGKDSLKEIKFETGYKDGETRRIRAVARLVEEIAEEKEIKEIWQKEPSETPRLPQ